MDTLERIKKENEDLKKELQQYKRNKRKRQPKYTKINTFLNELNLIDKKYLYKRIVEDIQNEENNKIVELKAIDGTSTYKVIY